MYNDKKIAEEINQLEILKVVTGVYGQIGSMWMNRARDSVLRSRDFLDEMNTVFMTVFASYTQEVRELAKKRKLTRNGKITFLAHNGKKVAVLLSANAGFYGDIIRRTFELFLADVRKENLEVAIVGRQGLSFFLSEEPTRPHTFFDFSDEHVDQSELAQLVRHLVQYEEIRIYYGKFQSFLTQDPVVFTLSSDPYNEMVPQTNPHKYIFEPSLEKILIFFEKQIFSSVFEQIVRESQLAKFASRIIVMDRAGENIKDLLKLIENRRLTSAHRMSNKRQQSMFSGMNLWNVN